MRRIALLCNCSVLLAAGPALLERFERRERIGPIGLAALFSLILRGFVALALITRHP